MRLFRSGTWRWPVVATAVGALALAATTTVLAVHNLNLFELDKDATAGAAAGNDWSSHFPGNNLAGALTVAFVADAPAAPDTTYFFGGGSKDIRDISQWKYNDNGAPDKDQITDAYTAAYVNNTDTGDNNVGDLIIYFGADRFAAEGDASIGFWFFKNSISLNASGTFNGVHAVGDFLVLSHFTNGGTVPEIKVFKWVGSGGSDGAINLIFDSNVADCASAGISNDDPACATVNSSATNAPWAYTPKFGSAGSFPPGTFFEGGINVTRLLGEACISTFMAETRSSHEPNATLHDLAGPTAFNTCGGITAHKYHDLNANGVNNSEPALSGWRLFIDKNNDSILQPNGADGQPNTADDETFGDTNASGDVVFTNLLAGTYRICEVLQANWVNSDPGAGSLADPDGTSLCENVTLGIAGSASVDFGNFQAATKSGVKFKDLNADGDDENGADPRLGGWQIHLFGKDGLNRDVHLHATTSSSAATLGSYSFSVEPGNYTVCETQQAGWKQTAPASGADCSAHGGGKGYAITLTSQQVDSGNNFGNAQLYRLLVLTCDDLSADPNNALVDGTVTLAGQTTKATITDVPASLVAKGVTEADLCGLGGASYGSLQQGNYTPGVELPDVAPLFP